MPILHVKTPNGVQSDVDLDKIVMTEGNQTISGIKTFNYKIHFSNFGEIGRMLTRHDGDTKRLHQLYFSTTKLENWNSDGGAKITLHAYDSDYSDREDGGFSILAATDTEKSDLAGYPDGRLNWCGESIYIVSCNTSSTCGHIRYGNGIQICWGGGGLFDVPRDDSYDRPFISAPGIGMNNGELDLGSSSNTGFHVYVVTSGITKTYYTYIAIGRWK